jgi:hypothetical protein
MVKQVCRPLALIGQSAGRAADGAAVTGQS